MRRRAAFTLIEILVVITILVILTTLIVLAFQGNNAQKVRDGGRVAQSSILGARDRALHAKLPRGFRVIRDPNDVNIGTGFAYVQKLDYLSYGPNALSLERLDVDSNSQADGAEIVIVRGVPGTNWNTFIDIMPPNPRIRIPSGATGIWYTFQVLTSGPYALSAANPVLRLTTGFSGTGVPQPAVVAFDTSSSFSSADLDLGDELLPMHAPMSLPSGVVIDLNNSSAAARGDIMFSPRGMVTGQITAQGPIYLLLRDVRDVIEGINPTNTTAGTSHRDMLIVAISPQTGRVQNFPIDQTDSDNNGTADDLFRFAKLGSAAGG